MQRRQSFAPTDTVHLVVEISGYGPTNTHSLEAKSNPKSGAGEVSRNSRMHSPGASALTRLCIQDGRPP